MAYRRIRGMAAGMTPAQRARANQTLGNYWQDFLDFWNPALPTSTVGANIYERNQYGIIPVPTPATVPGGAAPGAPVSYDPSTGTVSATNTSGETVEITDPQARAQALTDLINQAISSGSYTPSGTPVASDLASLFGNIPGWAWAVGGVVGLGLVLSLVGGRR